MLLRTKIVLVTALTLASSLPARTVRADAAPSGEASSLPCSDGAASVEALCGCLLEDHKKNAALQGEGAKCEVEVVAAGLGAPELVAVAYGTEMPGERFHVLVAKDGAVVRPVADLGHDYTPGAFGVDNVATVVGGAVRAVGGYQAVVVKSEQRDRDFNAAGLELCSTSIDMETVCALGSGDVATRCVTVPMSIATGCGPGVEPGPQDLTPETKATLAELKKAWKTSKAKLRWSIAKDGKLVVQKVSGDASLVPPGIVAKHALFRPAPGKGAAGKPAATPSAGADKPPGSPKGKGSKAR